MLKNKRVNDILIPLLLVLNLLLGGFIYTKVSDALQTKKIYDQAVITKISDIPQITPNRQNEDQQKEVIRDDRDFSDIEDVITENKPGTPARISIPKIKVNTLVEHVGLDPVGNMDVPVDPFNTGWYKYGALPGENGNSVIAGHLDTKTGPAIFSRLHELRTGDEVIVTDNLGNNRTFKVYKVSVYSERGFPINTIFGSSNEAYLNLITCTGAFDEHFEDYTDRLVVFTKLDESED